MTIHKHHLILFFSFLIISISPFVVVSQGYTDNNDLLELLQLVPDTNQGTLYYADITASMEIRNVPQIESLSMWQEIESSFDPVVSLHHRQWLATIPYTIFNSFIHAFRVADETLELNGIDLLTIERSLYHDNGLESITVLEGNFDREQILRAYQSRSYIQQEDIILTYLCPKEGCDALRDLDEEPGDIFGGMQGRNQAIGLADNLIFSSPDEAVMNDWIASHTGEQTTLMDNPLYQTLSGAMFDMGIVRAATFVLDTALVKNNAITGSDADALSIPDFEGIAFADVVNITDNMQRGTLFLVYDDEADAITATQNVFSNLQNKNVSSSITDRSFAEIMQRGDANLVEGTVYFDRGTDYYVARIILESPVVSYGTVTDMDSEVSIIDELPGGTFLMSVQSGNSFKLWTQIYQAEDTPWLAIVDE